MRKKLIQTYLHNCPPIFIGFSRTGKLGKAVALSFIFLVLFMFLPEPVSATQAHGAPEGLYTHQFTHLFFFIAMGFLIYWLYVRGLARQPGWREIRYAAFFFMLWTIDAFGVHLIDEQFGWVQVTPIGSWQMKLDSTIGSDSISGIYYLMKMDHLLCVPGLIFLAIGLGKLGGISSPSDEFAGESLDDSSDDSREETS